MNRLFFTMAFTLLALFSCKGYGDLSVAEFDEMRQDDAVQLVDVRTPDEFAEGHLPGASNLDWYAEDFIDLAKGALDPARPVMVYCRSGKRSKEAAQKPADMGYTNIYEFGGINTRTGEAVAE